MDNRYLVRAYLFSVAMLSYYIWILTTNTTLSNFEMVALMLYAVICTIIFPFSKLVWDEIKQTILGNNTIFSVGIWAVFINFIVKVLINALLWFFAIFVAPLGILYLWIKGRNQT